MNRPPTLDLDLAGLDLPGWSAALEALGDEFGYLDRVGPRHRALFIDAGPRLLVTFETVAEIRDRPGQAPRGLGFARRMGWSLLALMSEGDTWFRDPAVYALFDRLTDDGFFEDFDGVLFAGTDAGGYAAAAFSVAAPGARVLALRPQATLDPAVAGWDTRHAAHRRLDFTSRYGYAPDMVDAAARAYVLHDPCRALDAMHAALFRRPNVTLLRAPLTGPRPDRGLDAMGLLDPLVEAAMDGTLDGAGFARLWRARRDSPAWLRALMMRLEARGRPGQAAGVCAHALRQGHRGMFLRKREEYEAAGFAVAAPREAAQGEARHRAAEAARRQAHGDAHRTAPEGVQRQSHQDPRYDSSGDATHRAQHAHPRRIEAAG